MLKNYNMVQKYIRERIHENKHLFSENEINFINQNEKCIRKIYLLGFIDAKDCYDKKK